MTRKLVVPVAAAAILALGGVLFTLVGRDFFPLIDGGQIQLHVRAPAGTRIEKTEEMFQAIEDKIREVIPDSERETYSITSVCRRAILISLSPMEPPSGSMTESFS